MGVINDIQEGQLDAAPRGAMYLPFYQLPNTGFVVLARTAQDERAMLPAMASTLRSIDAGMAIFQPMTMEEKIHDAPATYLHRSSAWLVGGFAGDGAAAGRGGAVRRDCVLGEPADARDWRADGAGRGTRERVPAWCCARRGG